MNRPLNEADEFLLSRLLDNDLLPEAAASLRARMEREPDLRKAYESMTRIDTLLAARRADQPQVDWARFHQQVMDQIEAEASKRVTIRLAGFLRVALPLAAAAVIALVIWLWPQGGSMAPKPDGVLPLSPIAGNQQLVPTAAATVIVVQYPRPESTDAQAQPVVRYARSDELLKEYQAMDKRNRGREPEATLMAGNIRSSQAISRELLAAASSLF